MAESHIFHRFVSSVPDDPTIPEAVRPQKDWNDSHIISGGNDGDVFVVDSTTSDGFSFQNLSEVITGRLIQIKSASGSYSGAGPSPALASLVITPTKTVSALLFIEAAIGDSTGSLANCGLTMVTDNVISKNYIILNGQETYTYVQVPTLNAGTHEFKGNFTANVNPITTCTLTLTVLTFG